MTAIAITQTTLSFPASFVMAIMSAIQGVVISIIDTGKQAMNRVISSERQETLKQRVVLFANTRPLLATLVLSQLAFSGIPLVLFILFTVAVLLSSLAAAVAVAVLGAFAITMFWIGLGLLLLLPALTATTFVAITAWLWSWVTYRVVRFLRDAAAAQWLNPKHTTGPTSRVVVADTEDERNVNVPDGAKASGSSENGTAPRWFRDKKEEASQPDVKLESETQRATNGEVQN
jgi:Promethin